MTRSEFFAGTGTSASNSRQYGNDITSFLDGSMVYGSSPDKLAALKQRTGRTCALSTQRHHRLRDVSDPVFATGS